MPQSEQTNRITAYFASSGQAAAAGDQLRSVLEITDPASMAIEAMSQSEASTSGSQGLSNQASASALSSAASGSYRLTVSVPQSKMAQANELIQAQGGQLQSGQAQSSQTQSSTLS
ncbi:MAG: hypothetical protein ACM3QZ_01675 [Solirubrobacterales bacterium]